MAKRTVEKKNEPGARGNRRPPAASRRRSSRRRTSSGKIPKSPHSASCRLRLRLLLFTVEHPPWRFDDDGGNPCECVVFRDSTFAAPRGGDSSWTHPSSESFFSPTAPAARWRWAEEDAAHEHGGSGMARGAGTERGAASATPRTARGRVEGKKDGRERRKPPRRARDLDASVERARVGRARGASGGCLTRVSAGREGDARANPASRPSKRPRREMPGIKGSPEPSRSRRDRGNLSLPPRQRKARGRVAGFDSHLRPARTRTSCDGSCTSAAAASRSCSAACSRRSRPGRFSCSVRSSSRGR